DVKMLNSVTAIAVGDSGKILRTSDAGQNWIEKFSRPHVTWNALAFANQQKGVAVGDSSKFAFTFDGGDSWIFVDSSSTRHLTAASYMGEFTLYVGDQLGTVYYSTDDGATWTSMSFGSGPVQDIFFTAGGLQQYWG
ncbi:MAG: hypothetical protein GWN00_28055, partial [Aliifodinibius sp.]|nr:hypothetical protein [Fodinibius sp.]NIY28516.1 hypothetical protein [Fodinibius sp.]